MSPLGFLLGELDELCRTPPRGLAVITVPVPVGDVDDVVARVQMGPGLHLLWDSPAPEPDGRAYSFVGWGEAARVEAMGEGRFGDLRRAAAELFATLTLRDHPELDRAPSPRLFGGLAFRPEPRRSAPWAAFRDGSFTMPRWLLGSAGDRAFLRLTLRPGEHIDRAEIEAALACVAPGDRGAREPSPPSARDTLVDRPSPVVWGAMVDDALARIRARELDKVVPAALCHVASKSVLDAALALRRVRAAYPECVRFAFQRGEGTFLGASPERLVTRRGLEVEVDALAGSRARGRTPEADERAVRALLESDKDLREHRFVAAAIERALRPLARAVHLPATPVIRSLHNVHHLWTPIHAVLDRPAHVLDLVELLHPTPAVCGAPRKAAIEWIAAHEPAARGWYAGAVGFFDASGDGAFSVAIRSGVLERHEAWLYAGAGIVEGSDPSAEYAETGVKHSPLLAAIGVLP